MGRVDHDISDRVLPGFSRAEPSVSCEREEVAWSSGGGEEGSGSSEREGVTEPSQVEFLFVVWDEPEDTAGEERSTIPLARDAASGAEAFISGIFRPSERAWEERCCARACSAVAVTCSTSSRYLSSSRTEPRACTGAGAGGGVGGVVVSILYTVGDGAEPAGAH